MRKHENGCYTEAKNTKSIVAVFALVQILKIQRELLSHERRCFIEVSEHINVGNILQVNISFNLSSIQIRSHVQIVGSLQRPCLIFNLNSILTVHQLLSG